MLAATSQHTQQGGDYIKIEAYQVQASAQRSYQKLEQTSLKAELWGSGGERQYVTQGEAATVSLSALAQEMLAQPRQQKQNDAQAGQVEQSQLQTQAPSAMDKYELKLRMLEDMLYSISGRRFSLRLHSLLRGEGMQPRHQPVMANAMRMGQTAGGQLTATHQVYEAEAVSYEAKGLIRTADGKSVSVDISLHMSRAHASVAQSSLQFGVSRQAAQNANKLVDPLVINYGGTATSLTGEKFAFDLDFDGEMDNISFTGPGSGFLALDKNGDGTINNGSELFGPNTGNGFDELRAYDQDGNGWIDENDAIFSQLRIWSKDSEGNDQLFTLLDLDVGAIYLGDVKTEFSLTDSGNNAQGVMRSTSFFLKESGGSGTVSHIDLVV